MKYYKVLFITNKGYEFLTVESLSYSKAKEECISVYQQYKRLGYVKAFAYLGTYEITKNENYQIVMGEY